MLGLGRTRTTPAQLALVLLFQYWGSGSEADEQLVPMLTTRAAESTVRTELFCLDYFAVCLGIEIGFGKSFGVRDMVLKWFHYFNWMWTTKDQPDTSLDSRVADAKDLLNSMLAEYTSVNREASERIKDNRKILPEQILVSSRHDDYRGVFERHGARSDGAYRAVATTFAEFLGNPRDPFVIAGAYTQLVMRMAMVRDVVPKYKLVTQ